MFAHVVGYDANGKNGLESLANFQLMSSHDGYLSQAANELKSEKNQGDNVVSTLDTSLQQTAYNALGENRGRRGGPGPRDRGRSGISKQAGLQPEHRGAGLGLSGQ